MGALAQRVIRELNEATSIEDFGQRLWIAGDLMKRAHSPGYRSGFEEIDLEELSEVEGVQIRDALVRALPRNSNPRWVGGILSALGSSPDPSLKQFWVDYLAKYLEQLKAANSVVYTALGALHDLGEPVFEPSFSGRSLAEVERNVDRAQRYLHERGITIPW